MSGPSRYHLFETAAGFVALGWTRDGVSVLRLPDSSADAAERALLRRLPDAQRGGPPPEIQAVVFDIARYFSGEQVDFTATSVDMGAQEPFFERVYAFVRGLGWGETATYGEVAKALGAGPESARAVGQAMARNPVPLIVPCHRVTGAGGKIGGFSAPGGSMSKARMLEMEGAAVGVDPAQPRFDF